MLNASSCLVSVIVTNYNYGHFISDTIKSVYAQTHSSIELIIIDDGSTDDSRRVIDSCIRGHKNTRLIKQKNKGVVASRNTGIERAVGDYILFLDGDDKLPSNYIKETLTVALRDGVDVVYTDFERFDGDNSKSNFYDYDVKKLRAKNYIHVSSLIKKSAIGSIRFDRNLKGLSHEDWDFVLALSYKGLKFKKISGTMLLYRAHTQSRSATNSKYALRAVKAYFYILNKYRDLYPGTIDIYEDSEVVEAWRLADEGRSMVADQKKVIDYQEKSIIEQQKHISTLEHNIDDILNSRRYYVGRIILSPLSFLKRFLHGEKNNNGK